MRIVLATCAALLIIGGVWTAAFTAVGSSDQPTVIAPAVVVGRTTSPTTSPSVSPTASFSPSGSSSEDDDDVTEVSPSAAVEVTDDHGGRQKGKDRSTGSDG